VTIYQHAHNDVLEDWTLNTAHIHVFCFFYSPCTEWFWSPLSLLFYEYQHSLQGVKQLGRIVNHSSPTSYKVWNEWSYTGMRHITTFWSKTD